MPQGGLSMFGAGLQLQQATPGVLNTGNFNISGVGIGGRFSTSTVNIGNQAELFGHNIRFAAAEPTNSVGIGNDVEFSTAGSSLVAVGFQVTCTSPGGIALGSTVQAGAVPSTGFANMVAVGKDVSVGAPAASVGDSVGMGYQVSVGPSKGVAFGSAVALGNSNTATSASVAFGIAISVGAGAERNVLMGNNISPASRINVVAIGDYQTGGYPASGPGQQNNSILLGNALQTAVKIGAYTIGSSTGTAVIVNDANHVIAAGIGTVIFNTLTAARTVTLPLANSLPAGSTIRTADFSGNCSAVNTITALASGADAILDPNTMKNAFDFHEHMTNGVDKWLRILDKTL